MCLILLLPPSYICFPYFLHYLIKIILFLCVFLLSIINVDAAWISRICISVLEQMQYASAVGSKTSLWWQWLVIWWTAALLVGESHIPRISHKHLPHPPAAWWCKESYFSTKKEVKDGSSDGRSAGNQLRAGMAISPGLERAGREQGKGWTRGRCAKPSRVSSAQDNEPIKHFLL